MPNVPKVFITHASQDTEIAIRFKKDVEKAFLGLCDLFVSSSLDSLHAGDEWLSEIKRNLNDAVILIGLVSQTAATRGWVYFEFGVGWIRSIPVIPLCHTGMSKAQLPAPLSIFQALDLCNADHLQHVYQKIAAAIQCDVPEVNFTELASRYHDITEVRRLKQLLTGWIGQLVQWNPQLAGILDGTKKKLDGVMIPSHLEIPFEEFRKAVEDRQLLKVRPSGFAMGTPVGNQASLYSVEPGEKFRDLAPFLGFPSFPGHLPK